jgi:hypothetical protein
MTLIIYIIGVFYALPLMYEYEPHQEKTVFDILHIDIDNKNIYRAKLTELGSNSVFRWTYVLINALAVYIIPLIIIAILNRKLLHSIRSLERRSAEYNAPLPTKQGMKQDLSSTILICFVSRCNCYVISNNNYAAGISFTISNFICHVDYSSEDVY